MKFALVGAAALLVAGSMLVPEMTVAQSDRERPPQRMALSGLPSATAIATSSDGSMAWVIVDRQVQRCVYWSRQSDSGQLAQVRCIGEGGNWQVVTPP